MTALIDIKPGQWVLAFQLPYGPYGNKLMTDVLEGYAFLHWMDNRDKDEVFLVHQVGKVMPKTFTVIGSSRYVHEGERLPRSNVIGTFKSQSEAMAFRDRFFSIGVETGQKIEAEMYRRIEKFSQREQAKALKRIHKLLPQHFGRSA